MNASRFVDTDSPAFAALVNHARTLCTAAEWDAMSNVERDMVASGAANVYGTEPVRCDDARVRTVVVRAVYRALLAPSVLLGEGTCPECQNELDINARCSQGHLDYLDCEPVGPRRERPFVKRFG